nr:immunoglobulin heavy chain junction region [Mus musculus]
CARWARDYGMDYW